MQTLQPTSERSHCVYSVVATPRLVQQERDCHAIALRALISTVDGSEIPNNHLGCIKPENSMIFSINSMISMTPKKIFLFRVLSQQIPISTETISFSCTLKLQDSRRCNVECGCEWNNSKEMNGNFEVLQLCISNVHDAPWWSMLAETRT